MRISRESDKHPKNKILHASQYRKIDKLVKLIFYLIIDAVPNTMTEHVYLT